ncbi:MAG: SPOR domain-containing protein [Betaproteobacteria bacterium]
MAEAQDVEALKRRGRRRLVGAVALVLAAVIVLPMLFDPEPKPAVSNVAVRIPGEGEAAFTPKPAPAPKTEPRAEPKAEPRPAAPQYVFQVGVFANPENVTAQLKTAKIPYYTEPMKDKLTRVRAGPFRSREAADKAHAQMKKLGLEPGAVTTRPG